MQTPAEMSMPQLPIYLEMARQETMMDDFTYLRISM